MIQKHAVQLLELQARLASALGQLTEVIKCTICGVPVTGPSQREHQVDCPLARELNVSVPKPEPKDKTSMDFSFGAKAKPVKSTDCKKTRRKNNGYELRTGDEFRRADGSFDRSAWAMKNAFGKRKTTQAQPENKQLGLPCGIGGL